MSQQTAFDDWLAAHPDAYGRRAAPKRKRVNYTERAASRLGHGIHPVSLAALREPVGEHTCGDCAHLTVVSLGHRYLKCELVQTSSEATDVRRKWPACVAWQ